MSSFAPIKGTRTEIENTPIVDGQYLMETDQGTRNKTYLDNNNERLPIGGVGHDMVPDPQSTIVPTEEAVISALQSAYSQPTNSQVASLYGISHWSNGTIKRYILTNIPANINTIGTWQDNDDTSQWDTSDWWFIPNLKDVLDNTQDGDDIEIKITFNPVNGESLGLIGYQLNDNDTRTINGEIVEGGSICIAFTSHTNPCDIAVELVYNHTETSTQTYSDIYV